MPLQARKIVRKIREFIKWRILAPLGFPVHLSVGRRSPLLTLWDNVGISAESVRKRMDELREQEDD